jgi:hypothetical protein
MFGGENRGAGGRKCRDTDYKGIFSTHISESREVGKGCGTWRAGITGDEKGDGRRTSFYIVGDGKSVTRVSTTW